MGNCGGRSSRTNTVMRTANTPSENAVSRSGVALVWGTVRLLTVRYRAKSRPIPSCSSRVRRHRLWQSIMYGSSGLSPRPAHRAGSPEVHAPVASGESAGCLSQRPPSRVV